MQACLNLVKKYSDSETVSVMGGSIDGLPVDIFISPVIKFFNVPIMGEVGYISLYQDPYKISRLKKYVEENNIKNYYLIQINDDGHESACKVLGKINNIIPKLIEGKLKNTVSREYRVNQTFNK